MEQYLKPREQDKSPSESNSDKSVFKQEIASNNKSKSCKDNNKPGRVKSVKQKCTDKITDKNVSRDEENGEKSKRHTSKKHNLKTKSDSDKNTNDSLVTMNDGSKTIQKNKTKKTNAKQSLNMSDIRDKFKKLCKNSQEISGSEINVDKDPKASDSKSTSSQGQEPSARAEKSSVVKCDAFKLLMDSQRKSIGSNSPGKLLEKTETIEDKELKEAKVKRELFLLQWAEKKGGKLKKEKEEQRETYVSKVLKKRAKTFKALLLNGEATQSQKTKNMQVKGKKNVTAKECGDEIKAKKVKDEMKTKLAVVNKSKAKKSVAETKAQKIVDQVNEEEVVDKIKTKGKGTGMKGKETKGKVKPKEVIKNIKVKQSVKELKTKESMDKIKPIDDESPSDVKIRKTCTSRINVSTRKVLRRQEAVDTSSQESTDDFLDKLSVSLKKKESMLSYFKVENGHVSKKSDVTIVDSDSENFKEEQESTSVLKVKFTPKKKGRIKMKGKLSKKKKMVRDNDEQELKKVNECDDKSEMKKSRAKNKMNREKIKKCIDNSVSIFNDEAAMDFDGFAKKENFIDKEVTDSKRPKRNIRKPIKYLENGSTDFEESSNSVDFQIFSKDASGDDTPRTKTKTKMKQSKTDKENKSCVSKENVSVNKVSPIKIINIKSPCAMQCIKSPKIRREEVKKDSALHALKNVKLAPLFVKNVPKPLVDPSVLEARHNFLHSGIPDAIKKQMEKTVNAIIDVKIFPSISHIQQIPKECDDRFYVWDLSPKLTNLDECDQNSDNKSVGDFTNIKLLSDVAMSCKFSDTLIEFPKCKVKEGLSKIKDANPDFPVYKYFRKFQETLSCLMHNISGSGIHQDSSVMSANDASDENSLLWTDKYKPSCSEHIVGNFSSIRHVKKWLALWKEYNEITYNKIPKRRKQDSDSSCDFLDSDTRDSGMLPDNTMVVIGPRGSGKTSSVYAIANELGINVLEVNASSKRTGKKMMSELLEATQSHKVLVKMSSEDSTNNFTNIFNKNGIAKSKNLELESNDKKMKNAKRKRSTTLSSVDDLSQRSTHAETQKMSLMLIEDADIVFDEDDGFVAALAQIVQTSKRPMIIVASDIRCPHLQRFMTTNNVIMYNHLPASLLAPWLDIVLLIESGRIIPGFSKSLLDINKGDMRKTMLQLQYWILGSAETTNIGREKLLSSKVTKVHIDVEESSPDYGFESLLEDDSNASFSDDRVVLFSDGKRVTSNRLKVDNDINKSTKISHNNSNIVHALSNELFCTFKLKNVFLDIAKIDQESINVNSTDKYVDLECVVDYYEHLSCIDLMMGCSKCGSDDADDNHPWQTPLTDGLSESEDPTSYKHYTTFCNDWCESVMAMSLDCFNKEELYNTAFKTADCWSTSEKRKSKSLRNKSYSSFCAAIPSGTQLDRRSVSLDYMATLRDICRSENSRSETNLKRNNRFYHYLKSLNINVKDNVFDYASNCFRC